MKGRVLFALSVAVLSLASVASADSITCINPGPNPDSLTACLPATFSAQVAAVKLAAPALFTYSVDENAIVTFNVPVVAGDVVLCDDPALICNASHPENWGDVLRFKSTGVSSGTATLFSDANEIGPVVPFDVNFANFGPLQSLTLFTLETGTEANNGISYNNGDSIGTIVSDSAVPEPSSLLLLGPALVAGLLIKRRREEKP